MRSLESLCAAMRKNNKITYVTLLGIQEASQQAARLSEEAIRILEGLDQKRIFVYADKETGQPQKVKEGYQ